MKTPKEHLEKAERLLEDAEAPFASKADTRSLSLRASAHIALAEAIKKGVQR